MKVIEKDIIIGFDCDDTLVMRTYPREASHCVIVLNDAGTPTAVVPNYQMIDCLKKNHSQGKYIVVWSANGHAWAKEVITKLKLTKYVDIIFPKFYLCFDDLPPSEFLMRAYLAPNWNDPRYSKKEG